MMKPIDLAHVIAERSLPDPKRPRLPEPIEQRLESIERRSAVCYASMEMLSARFRDLAERVSREWGAEVTEPQEMSDSLAIRLGDLKQKAGV
jgi:hypothetical protein